MTKRFVRTEKLIGATGLEKLQNSHVAVFGLGGVGGHAAEALARAGIGQLTLVDNDTVAPSNLNRQLVATMASLGEKKVRAMTDRIASIDPGIVLHGLEWFVLPNTVREIDFTDFDYIIDAIDTVSGKLALAAMAKEMSIPIISAMGAGNKLDPCAFTVTDMEKTAVCPLARIMRKELKKKCGITHMKVVYSTETALKPTQGNERGPGSISFVPGVAGMIAAGEAIKDIINGSGVIPY